MAEQQQFRPGLEGVVASETNISYLDVEAEQIVIRGYDLIELANRVCFLDVVGLLLDGKLPSEEERNQLEADLAGECWLPEAVLAVLKYQAPHKDAMDMLRTGISVLASFDDELADRSTAANRRKTLRLLAKVPVIVANGYRLQMGQQPLPQRKDLSYVANFLYMLTGKAPNAHEERAFDQSLIVYSEHEMPNSTFVARVIASTQSDLYGALTGAVASLKGTLHGGANEAVMNMLLEAKTISNMEPLIMGKLAAKERIMGFGHRVYMRKMDPRALLMKEALAKLSEIKGDHELYRMCELGEQIMLREKGLYPISIIMRHLFITYWAFRLICTRRFFWRHVHLASVPM
jgi:citrate synthase